MHPALVGLVIGVLLVFPGLEIMRLLCGKVTGFYPGMTLTEACLAMMVVLLSVIAARSTRQPRADALRGPRVLFPPPIPGPPRRPRRHRPAAIRRARPVPDDDEPAAPSRARKATRPSQRTRVARTVADDDPPPPSRRHPRATDRDRRASATDRRATDRDRRTSRRPRRRPE